ncbi:thiamine phosphate synthase [Roseimicrobium sp. ORNL1]|uniref:thiamine phosphate synthase n=1 Tax=Roseimicrobium sp. ORNL1 TaxID=2711231 RepID=UPI0013E1BC8D|nr:thiamine phosphate synthase [Roseimicrobium sp. ORNL1]QIF04553.1 thiamine phosphate synthase [Roseimicrobium sp. ORNL1]
MRPIEDCHLYGIVDLGYVSPENVAGMTHALVEGGVEVLQLRAKKLVAGEVERLAEVMLPITRAAGVPLVINDHPTVAASVRSEGIHVGQDDLSVAEVRALVGPDCFVGKSTHSVAQARAAMEEGADYIGFGPLYATGTKPDYTPIGLQDIGEVHSFATRPVFCIGGVNWERLPEILAAGARRVVVVSAFLCAPDVRVAVRQVKDALEAQWKVGG